MNRLKTFVIFNFMLVWWFPILVGLLLLVGTSLIIIPKVNQTIEMSRSLNKLESDLENAEKKIIQLEGLDENLIDELHFDFKQALPAHKPYYEVVLLLQQLRDKSGVVLGDFELNPGSLATSSAVKEVAVNADGYVRLDTALDLYGTTSQVTMFIEELQQSLPLIMVSNMSMSGKVADDDSLRHARIDLEVLYQMESNNITKMVNVEPLTPLSNSVNQVAQRLSEYYDPELEKELKIESMDGFVRTDIFNFE